MSEDIATTTCAVAKGLAITLPELRCMTTAALFIVLTSGAWLIGVAFLMAFKPRQFLDLLSLTAANWRINVIEQGLRLVAGLALIARGEASKLPTLLPCRCLFWSASRNALSARFIPRLFPGFGKKGNNFLRRLKTHDFG